MPCHGDQRRARGDLPFDIGQISVNDFVPRRDSSLGAIETLVHRGQHIGVLISRPAQHHTINMRQMFTGLRKGLDAAIDGDMQIRAFSLQAIDQIVMQRRDFPVLPRAQAFQPGLASMHGDIGAARRGHCIDKADQGLPFRLIVDRNPVLDRHRDAHGCAHGVHAARHQLWFGHQAGPETSGLHPVGRTAHIEIDLVIAQISPDTRAFGQRVRLRATQLQRNRKFGRVIG